MNCANHPEVNAAAFCRECGKPMCAECQRPALGSVYCAEHLPVTAKTAGELRQPPPLPDQPRSGSYQSSSYQTGTQAAGSQAGSYQRPAAQSAAWSNPYTAPVSSPAEGAVVDPSVHPGLALFLGFFPGVGAIYNGQYAKGLVHAVIFGLLISLITNSHNGGMAAFLAIGIATWVIYQAFEAFHTARKRRFGLAVEEFSSLFDIRPVNGKFPLGAILLIGVGFVLLLDTTDIIDMQRLERYWPVLLIGVGVYMLYARLSTAHDAHGSVSDGGARR